MIRIVTPLSRYQNLTQLVPFWRSLNIQWHLILDAGPFRVSFPSDSDWIHMHLYRGIDPAGSDPCLTRLNWFLDAIPLHRDDKYCFINDDDAVELDFVTKVEKSAAHVTIVSLKRGDNIPPNGLPHGTNTLVADKENMKPAHCSLEQLVVTGHVAQHMQFPVENMGDGMLIQKLCADWQANYLPETYAYFNYFQPGRWNK